MILCTRGTLSAVVHDWYLISCFWRGRTVPKLLWTNTQNVQKRQQKYCRLVITNQTQSEVRISWNDWKILASACQLSKSKSKTVERREPETFASRNTKFYKAKQETQSPQVARKSEPVSKDRFLWDLNLRKDIFSAHALLFASIHVISVTDFQ